jgi:hypothetical protein
MMANAVDYSITPQLRADIRQWRTRALIAGVLGSVVSAAGFFIAGPTPFYRSYLWSFMFIVALTLGPLAWLMLQYVTGGAWGLVIRRACEAAARTVPLTALMFLPILIGINNLYPWPHAKLLAADELLRHKQPYLNVPFFLARAAIYFAGWWFLSWWFNRWSATEDREGHDAVHGRMGNMAGPGLLFNFVQTWVSKYLPPVPLGDCVLGHRFPPRPLLFESLRDRLRRPLVFGSNSARCKCQGQHGNLQFASEHRPRLFGTHDLGFSAPFSGGLASFFSSFLSSDFSGCNSSLGANGQRVPDPARDIGQPDHSGGRLDSRGQRR